MSYILNKLMRIYTMLHCGFLFGKDCFVLTVQAFLGKANRLTTNKSMHEGAKKLLQAVKSNYQMIQEKDFALDLTKPRIYMSNHLSLFDTPLFYATINDTIRIVTKKELTKVPLIGNAILQSEHAIVDRHAKEQHQDFYRDAKKKLQEGVALWFFPEGTRSRSGELLPFKMGGFRLAAELGAQIIPVGIIGTNKILPVGKLMPFLNQPSQIKIGRVIDASQFATPELQQVLQEQVREEILRLTAQ